MRFVTATSAAVAATAAAAVSIPVYVDNHTENAKMDIFSIFSLIK